MSTAVHKVIVDTNVTQIGDVQSVKALADVEAVRCVAKVCFGTKACRVYERTSQGIRMCCCLSTRTCCCT